MAKVKLLKGRDDEDSEEEQLDTELPVLRNPKRRAVVQIDDKFFFYEQGKAVEYLNDEASFGMKKNSGTSSNKSKSKDTATKSKGKSKDDDKVERSTKSKFSGNFDDELIKSKYRSQKHSGAKATSGKGKSQGSSAKSEKKRKR